MTSTSINISYYAKCFTCHPEKEEIKSRLIASGEIEEIILPGERGLKTLVSRNALKQKVALTKHSVVEKLIVQGATVVQILTLEETRMYEKKFLETLYSLPEYQRLHNDPTKTPNGKKLIYTAGGFGALGTPSSFHNDLVRELRMKAYEKMLPIFQELLRHLNIPQHKLQVLFDRMMFRLAGQSPMAEAWHRDVMKTEQIEEQDIIFGGWLNFDPNHDQQFNYIPSSHLNQRVYGLKDGFACIYDYLKSIKPPLAPQDIKDAMNNLTSKKATLTIPPGYLVIFPQYILHEVVAVAQTYDMIRLFMGWRLTTSNRSIYLEAEQDEEYNTDNQHGRKRKAPKNEQLIDILDQILDKGQVPQLPGGMIPPMYSANHGRCFINKPFCMIPKDISSQMSLQEWSTTTFQPNVIATRTNWDLMSPNFKQQYTLVDRHMKSLSEYGFTFKPYSEQERKIYKPHNL